jgi:hypothetical protein
VEQTQASGREEQKMTEVVIRIDDARVMATFDDNAAARQFLSLRPMALTLEDYSGTEKVSDLPVRWSTEGAPEGLDPEVGDILITPHGGIWLFFTGILATRVDSYAWGN